MRRSRSGASRSSSTSRSISAGRDVILVEDIVDTGLTSRYMLSVLGARGPASLRSARSSIARSDGSCHSSRGTSGFDCPDTFVVGYGLDYRERYRNLPDILRVDDLAALRADPDVLAPLLTDAAA